MNACRGCVSARCILFNNLWGGGTALAVNENACVEVGIDANILIENGVFDGVSDAIDSTNYMPSATTVVLQRGNIYTAVSGQISNRGTAVFTPPYTYANLQEAGCVLRRGDGGRRRALILSGGRRSLRSLWSPPRSLRVAKPRFARRACARFGPPAPPARCALTLHALRSGLVAEFFDGALLAVLLSQERSCGAWSLRASVSWFICGTNCGDCWLTAAAMRPRPCSRGCAR